MPYKSEAQRKYFNANREKLEAEGVDVDEWNESSKGKKLPEKAEKKAFTPDTSFADGYDEAQLREALAERVRMIAQLRAHRDALLDDKSGYKQASLASGLFAGARRLLPKILPKRTVYRGAPDPLDFSKGKVVEGVPQLHASSNLATAKRYVPKGGTSVGSFKVPRDQKYFVPFGLEGKEPLPSMLRQGHTVREAKSFAKSNPLQVVPYDAARGQGVPDDFWFDYLPMSVRRRYQKPGQRVVPVPKGEKAKSPVSIKDIIEGLTYETAVTPAMKSRYKQANYSVVQNMAWIAAQQEKSAGNYLRNSLIGAGIGGLVGGFSDWMNEDENKPEDSLLDGILGGATVGGLGGLGYTAFRDLRNKSNQAYAEEPYADQFPPPSDVGQVPIVPPSAAPLTEADKARLRSQGFLRGPRARMSELPSSSRSDAKSLADNLPENYREEAQRNAQRYRDRGEYFIDSAEIDKPFMQDISDRAIDRKVNIKRMSPEEIGNIGGDRNANALHIGFQQQPVELDYSGREIILDSPKAVKDEIVVPFGPIDKNTLGHELTHATQDAYTTGSRNANKRPYYKRNVENLMKNRGLSRNQASRYAEYLTNPSEEEAYLAGIKRRYFESTGKHVKNQKDALKALEWAKRNPDNNIFDGLLEDSFMERAVGSEEKKNWIRGLIERMPGLVKDNTLNSGIKTAGTSKMDNNDIANLAKESVAALEKQAFNAAVMKGIGTKGLTAAKGIFDQIVMPSAKGFGGSKHALGQQVGQSALGSVGGYYGTGLADPDASLEQKLMGALGGGVIAAPAFRKSLADRGLQNFRIKPIQTAQATNTAFEPMSERAAKGMGIASGMIPSLAAKGGLIYGVGGLKNVYGLTQQANQQPTSYTITTNDGKKKRISKEIYDKLDFGTQPKGPTFDEQVAEAQKLLDSGASTSRDVSGIAALNRAGGDIGDITSTIQSGTGEATQNIVDATKGISEAAGGLDKLVETTEGAAKGIGDVAEAGRQFTESTKPMADLAETANRGLQSAGAGLKSFGNWVGDNYGKLGLGALGAAGLYGLYKVMRRKAEEKEEDDKERSRYVYRMPKTAADFGTITAMQVKEAENQALNTSFKISPHTAIFGGTLGAGVGGLHGLLKDPGYDEETGKKKSRLMSALKGLGMGGAIGAGAGGLLPPASVLATQGYGKFLMPLHERLSELQEQAKDEVATKLIKPTDHLTPNLKA